MYHSLFIYSQADGHLSSFQFSAVMIKAALIIAYRFRVALCLDSSWVNPSAQSTLADLAKKPRALSHSLLHVAFLPSTHCCLGRSGGSSALKTARSTLL